MRLNNGWLHVVTLSVIAVATNKHFAALRLGLLNQAHNLVERVLGNHGTDEVLEVLHGAYIQ